MKASLLRSVLTESEKPGTRPSNEYGTMLLSHLMDAQSALKPDQPTGCSASLYAAARSKASVDRKRLVATTMTECLLGTAGLATTLRTPVTIAIVGLEKITTFYPLPCKRIA